MGVRLSRDEYQEYAKHLEYHRSWTHRIVIGLVIFCIWAVTIGFAAWLYSHFHIDWRNSEAIPGVVIGLVIVVTATAFTRHFLKPPLPPSHFFKAKDQSTYYMEITDDGRHRRIHAVDNSEEMPLYGLGTNSRGRADRR